MAELALSIIGLAGLFNNAVDCFAYIQLGRNSSRDYKTCQIALDCVELRLSRWGASVGLGGDDVHDSTSTGQQQLVLANTNLQQSGAENVRRAKDILTHIIQLLEAARKTASSDSGSSNNVAAARTADDQTLASLRKGLRKISLSRMNKFTLVKKVKWALNDEVQLRQLISDLRGLVADLVDLFPQAHALQADMSRLEVDEIAENPQSLPLLVEAAAQDDELSEAARVYQTRSEAMYNINFSGNVVKGNQTAVNNGNLKFTWN